VTGAWTAYREFGFASGDSDIRRSERNQVAEIVEYMQRNPSLHVGIDGTIASGSSSSKKDLADRRVNAIRSALIDAGIPAHRIETGPFGDPRHASEGRVEVLLVTRN
jgi:outer membrane protein OmpA-like peptidoglycan-associated protein